MPAQMVWTLSGPVLASVRTSQNGVQGCGVQGFMAGSLRTPPPPLAAHYSLAQQNKALEHSSSLPAAQHRLLEAQGRVFCPSDWLLRPSTCTNSTASGLGPNFPLSGKVVPPHHVWAATRPTAPTIRLILEKANMPEEMQGGDRWSAL